jgi:hypothetical protein
MTSPSLPLLATNELVAVAWLGSIPAIEAVGGTQLVATTLPPDAGPDGKAAAWTSTGFITVAVVGGSPNAYIPVKQPVFQVDCWATRPGSNRPPWDRANLLMETIRYATLQRTGFNRVLALSARGVQYPSAVVDSACFLTEPHRDYSDAADYARYIVNLQLIWRTVDDVIP